MILMKENRFLAKIQRDNPDIRITKAYITASGIIHVETMNGTVSCKHGMTAAEREDPGLQNLCRYLKQNEKELRSLYRRMSLLC